MTQARGTLLFLTIHIINQNFLGRARTQPNNRRMLTNRTLHDHKMCEEGIECDLLVRNTD
jgi:hypothetical protein